jgi:16S rRNA (adenine1518-N6/adenine1519-N6)-dimethyltransferase
VIELLERYEVRPSRALGQNFVVDPNTVSRIARLAGVGDGDHVVEIGAGLGSLTRALLATGASVTAVELDRRLVSLLDETLGSHVRLIAGDALRLDWDDVLQRADGPAARWVLVANLPYNIATPLVLELLERAPAIVRMLVMVQREVGERLAAAPGSKAYGAVSAKVAYWATARLAGRVPPTVFVPAPRVESALVSIERRAEPAVGVVSQRALFGVIDAGFGHRRKMLRGALAGIVSAECFETAGVAPTARAEELDIDAWGRLAACASSLSPS